MAGPSAEMKAVAKRITVRCLRRWDGFLGIRASSDGVGRRAGIWKDKFDGVHYAVLLLAMSRLNETLKSAAMKPSKLQPAKHACTRFLVFSQPMDTLCAWQAVVVTA